MIVAIGKPAAAKDVVDVLLECHARIRKFLALAQKIGGASGNVDEACDQVLRYFADAFPLHVRDEEESIEPRMRGLSVEIDQALATMHADHQQHAPLVEEMLLKCRTRDRQALAKVACDLAQAIESHLTIEERVIFPAMRALLTQHAQQEILAELRARRA